MYNEIDEKIGIHAKILGDIADIHNNLRKDAETRDKEVQKYAEELRTCENKRDYFEIIDIGEPGSETCKGIAMFKEGEYCNQSIIVPDGLQQQPLVIEPSYFSDTLVCPDVDECLEKGNYGECQDYGYDPKDMKKGLRYDPDFRSIGFGNSNIKGETSYMCPAYIPCFKKEEEARKQHLRYMISMVNSELESRKIQYSKLNYEIINEQWQVMYGLPNNFFEDDGSPYLEDYDEI
mgnify:CR=1 FL=1